MSIDGYENVNNNSNRVLLTELYTEVLIKAVTYYCLDHINLEKVKQNNGKENMFKHIFQGYILPKDKQSKISMTVYNVENSLGKGREIS